jgi:ATP-binding cassette subfamily B protein/subfamily B ATP-binding cassette protein MsbA
MWSLDPTLTLVAVLVAVPMGFLIRLFGSRMTEEAYRHQQAEGVVWSTAEQSLTALPLVQAFGREKAEELRFRKSAAQSMRAYLATIATQLQFKAGVDGSEAVGAAVIMALGGLRVLDGAISVGTLVIFLSYLAVLYAPLNALAYLSATIASAAASARRVTEVLDSHQVLAVAPDARALAPAKAPRGRSVRFEHVSFGYEPGRPVLHDVTCEAGPGEVLALAGPSGAGKTSMVSLIPRLFDPWQGRVLLDGQDIRQATLESVRAQVAMVLQDPFLLPMSVADNIAYGRPDATRAEIVAAAEAARVDEFARGLPKGYDTVIGERGQTLSGGQRQRIAIARAVLKDAPILILDEPTSALDAGTEHFVMRALQRLMAGRTCFIIAHRLSTLRQADRILVLDKGRIGESGTHAQLMRSGGVYRRLYLAQDVSTAAPERETVLR